jgi:hypothetical protein
MTYSQEIFDTVALHLFDQGERAQIHPGQCVYRTSTGNACAVGCLIPDEIYSNDMECNNVPPLFDKFCHILPSDIFNYSTLDLLSCLQHAHDCSFSWANTEEMRIALREVADAYNLDSGILQFLSFGDR